ncbi:MAG: DUF2079 domain-containing protein [Candidatus Promineifilaceae bacterium]|nr:DUF2079 domain-containing protein [Candidatus Promineifilaceae bacterium]
MTNLAAEDHESRQPIWPAIGIALLALLFTLILSYFFISKHNAFNTRTYDFGRFAQAIWNVLHGRFLFTTIDYRSILGNHFSPYMALLAPLLLLWPDERVLLVAQVAGVAVSGILLALILYRRYPILALIFLLAFYLNPALHELALFEFRRVVLIMPFLALALLALDREKKWLMTAALLVALLGKEDVGLFVAGFGLYFLLVKRNWLWGLGLIFLGLGWSVVVSLWVIPAFRTPGSEYPQLYYFDYLGSSYTEILSTLRNDPLIFVRQVMSLDRLAAIGRILLPLGFFLPFLAAGRLLILLPPLALLMLSGDAEIYGLLKWYPTTLLPVLYAATAVGISNFQLSKARLLTGWLLGATLLGYWLFSPLPGGRAYDPALYRVTEHDRQAAAVIDLVPEESVVAAFPHYVPHLVRREGVYHYPWIKIGLENVEYLIFDCSANCYPLSKDEYAVELSKILANPNQSIITQTDDIYLFKKKDNNQPSFPLEYTAENAYKLVGFDVFVQDAEGLYQPLPAPPVSAHSGQPLMVHLYWESLAANGHERTISVRLLDAGGNLVAQHDGLPAGGSKPTSWWQTGEQIRDIHPLHIPDNLPPGSYSLEMLIYDSYTQERIPFDHGLETIQLAEIIIE